MDNGLTSNEVKSLCFSLIRRFFAGEISQSELEEEIKQIEVRISPGTQVQLDLHDQTVR